MSENNQGNKPNLFCYFGGGVIIFLNYFRHNLFGYRTPRTFSSDFGVIYGWLKHYSRYAGESVKDKVILELGPGSDLGIGLIFLAMGAKKYIALDFTPLLEQTAPIFYSRLLDKIKAEFPNTDISNLQEELSKCLSIRVIA